MQHTIQLVVGDPSGDGHERTSSLNIVCNLSSIELNKAYKAGTKLVGYDFSVKVACDYEDSSISKQKLEKLFQLGYAPGFEFEEDGKGGYSLCTEDFFRIFLFICKLGYPNLKWKKCPRQDTIFIGGYGLL
jgi:hypothetical protein